MKLAYYKDLVPNFGDELNGFLWERLLPDGFLDNDESVLFVGIGSIIEYPFNINARKIVVGSGYGGYGDPPNVNDGSWDICFVRGPRTAALLGLPAKLSICDGAILLRAIELPPPLAPFPVGFMPHFESMARGKWVSVCRLAGIRLIDPRDPVPKILSEIRAAGLLITEAMHGAIVADALRTPWIAATPTHPVHRAKWLDWSEALGIALRPRDIGASSLREYLIRLGKTYEIGRLHSAARNRWPSSLDAIFAHLAARNLRAAALCEPQLSGDRTISRVTDQALSAVRSLVRDRA